MGKKKHTRGRRANLKQPNGWRLWRRRFCYNINPFGKGLYAFRSVFADIALLLGIGLIIYEIWVVRQVWTSGREPIYTVWIFVVLGSVCLSLCFVPICGVRWDKEYTSATMLSYSSHLAYIFLMLNAFIDYLPQPDPSNKKDLHDLGTPYMCLMVFLLVEATVLLYYAHDVVRSQELNPPGRWWVRTTPYACIGSIFVIVLHWMKDTPGYSTFYSVAVSVLAVNYLMQIINDRIAPREGPYKKLHHQRRR